LNNSDLILHLVEQLLTEREKNIKMQQEQEKNQSQMQKEIVKTNK
jgi:hypothetical protein